jgi:phosphoribosylglycinamide formyltransferase
MLVLSNRKAAFGLERAKKHSIPTGYKALQPYLKADLSKTREDYDGEIAQMVLAAEPDLVVLAGWMHVFSQNFLDYMNGSIKSAEPGSSTPHIPPGGIPVINLHPALPGAFDGANAIDRAYEAFQRGEISESGAMVHRVVKEVDRGEPIIVRRIPMTNGESKEDFETRLHAVEWEIIVEAVKTILDPQR